MRSRNIKPGFYKNDELSTCTVWARLLAPGLWMLADRDGKLKDRPRQIKAEIFPFDDVDVGPLLEELHRVKHIIRYNIDGRQYIKITGFTVHQKTHFKEKQSVMPDPAPTQIGAGTNLGTTQHQPRSLPAVPSFLNVDMMNDEYSSSEELIPVIRPPKYSTEFEIFWLAYPKYARKEKPNAYAQWKKSLAFATAFDITTSAILYEKSARGGFAPYPAKWLKNQRWTEDHSTGVDDAKRNNPQTAHAGKTKTDRLNDVLAKHLNPSPNDGGGGPAGEDARAMLSSSEAVWQGARADVRNDSDV